MCLHLFYRVSRRRAGHREAREISAGIDHRVPVPAVFTIESVCSDTSKFHCERKHDRLFERKFNPSYGSKYFFYFCVIFVWRSVLVPSVLVDVVVCFEQDLAAGSRVVWLVQLFLFPLSMWLVRQLMCHLFLSNNSSGLCFGPVART